MIHSFAHNSLLGKTGEQRAVDFLQAKNLQILEINFRTNKGEIDIIARDQTTLVFVEVKTRSTDTFGSPAKAVNHRKRTHISRVARQYMEEKAYEGDFRYDIVSILPDHIDHFENITMF